MIDLNDVEYRNALNLNYHVRVYEAGNGDKCTRSKVFKKTLGGF